MRMESHNSVDEVRSEKGSNFEKLISALCRLSISLNTSKLIGRTKRKSDQTRRDNSYSSTIIRNSFHLRPYSLAILVCYTIASIYFVSVNLQRITSKALQRQPHFTDIDTSEHVQRIAVGRPVTFKCTVDAIGDHKLAWFHKDKRLLLALDNKTVAWKDRIHVSSQANSVFFLKLDTVQLSDKGHFMCQLNTQPAQSQVHILDVVKSPQIKEQETTINIEPVKEFGSVELRCAADGIPKPQIKWRRESQMHLMPNTYEEESESGEEANDNGVEDRVNGALDSGDASQVAGQGTRPSSAVVVAKDNESHSDNDIVLPDQTSPTANNSSSSERNSSSSSGSSSISSSSKVTNATRSPLVSQPRETDKVESPNGIRSQNSSNYLTATTSGASNSSMGNSIIAEGEVLRLERVTHQDMGYYICIATNGIPPSVSQRIFLPVSFIPTRLTTGAKTLTSQAAQVGGSGGQTQQVEDNQGNNSTTTTTAASSLVGSSSSGRPSTGSRTSSQILSPKRRFKSQHFQQPRTSANKVYSPGAGGGSASSSAFSNRNSNNIINNLIITSIFENLGLIHLFPTTFLICLSWTMITFSLASLQSSNFALTFNPI